MKARMTHAARGELANALRPRYSAASGKVKRRILEEFIAASGYHEKSRSESSTTCLPPRGHLAQTGKRHDSTKVLRGFGDASVLEVIESQAGNAYRAVYTVRFAAAVIVLHVFQKKSKSGIETPKPDMDLIEARLKNAAELMKVSKS
jgi:phage-related protein